MPRQFSGGCEWTCVRRLASANLSVRCLTTVQMKLQLKIFPLDILVLKIFRRWYSGRVTCYVRRKTYFYRSYQKMDIQVLYIKFPNYRKLMTPTLISDRLTWVKSIDDNLRRQTRR
jgi:hypothetical protein